MITIDFKFLIKLRLKKVLVILGETSKWVLLLSLLRLAAQLVEYLKHVYALGYTTEKTTKQDYVNLHSIILLS